MAAGGSQITLTDACSDQPVPLYLKNIVEVEQRYVTDTREGRPFSVAVGSVVHSKPGNYIDNVLESPQQIAQMIEDLGGTVTFF